MEAVPVLASLNYVGHRTCVHKASLAVRKEKMHVELGELASIKELAGGQQRNRFHRATRNGSWLRTVPHRLNVTELSWDGRNSGIIFASDMG